MVSPIFEQPFFLYMTAFAVDVIQFFIFMYVNKTRAYKRFLRTHVGLLMLEPVKAFFKGPLVRRLATISQVFLS